MLREYDTVRVMAIGGIGDVLLTTPALRALKLSARGRRVKVYCGSVEHFDVLTHNPFIDTLQLVAAGPLTIWLRGFVQNRLRSLAAARGPCWTRGAARLADRWRTRTALYSSQLPSLINRHAIELIGDMLGVRIENRTLVVGLTAEEQAWAADLVAQWGDSIAIHVKSQTSANQQWPISKWESLIRNNPSYTFVQLGGRDDAPAAGAVDMRGRTSFREAIAVLSRVRSFVGVVASLAHATNAVGTPGVVLFGPSSPQIWGHPNNINLTRGLRCSPCVELLGDAPCPYGAPCVADIGVDAVERALEAQLRQDRSSRSASALVGTAAASL